MIVMFLAPGFEEVEALAPLDLLRRAGLKVVTVAVREAKTNRLIEKLNRIGVSATNLDASPVVEKTLELAAAKDAYLCAICAAPLVLGKRGYLNGKRATCFPGFEEYLTGATVGGKVIRDGKIITAAGMGVAQEFGLEMISALVSPEKAGEIRSAIQSL